MIFFQQPVPFLKSFLSLSASSSSPFPFFFTCLKQLLYCFHHNTEDYISYTSGQSTQKYRSNRYISQCLLIDPGNCVFPRRHWSLSFSTSCCLCRQVSLFVFRINLCTCSMPSFRLRYFVCNMRRSVFEPPAKNHSLSKLW